MAIAVNLRTHHRWEDWLGVLLGLLIIISPWVMLPAEMRSAEITQPFMLNALIAGIVIGFLAALELEALQPWEEWGNMALGLWVAASPWIFDYSQMTSLMVSHVVLGLVVTALAAIERWQDTRRTPAPE